MRSAGAAKWPAFEPSELDHIVYYWDPKLARLQRAWHLLRYFPKSLGLLRSRGDKEVGMLRIGQTLRDTFGLGTPDQDPFCSRITSATRPVRS